MNALPPEIAAVVEQLRGRIDDDYATVLEFVTAAEGRYLTDAEFHARAYRAASMTRLAVVSRGVDVEHSMMAAMTLGAAVALLLAERGDE